MSPIRDSDRAADTEPLPVGSGETLPDAGRRTSRDAASDTSRDDDTHDDAHDGDAPGSGRRVPNWRPGPGRPERTVPRVAVVVLVLAFVALILAASMNLFTGAIDRLNPFRNGVVQEQTIDRSGPAVLKSISDLGEFHAASGYYELVVDVEKDVKPVPSFLAGERTLFVAAGDVDVVVDFRKLKDDAVKINADRTQAILTLPRPTLAEPVVNTDRSYVYQHERGLVDRLRDAFGSNPGQEQQLYALAKQKLAAAAQGSGELTTRGEATTRAMLVGLLRSLGFTDVQVRFEGDPGL
jgi:hypothetical protein